jgi:hypothetical protein
VRRAERHAGNEVIDDLRQNPRPVDRIDPGQGHPVAEGEMVEHAFDDRLAIVEVSGQGQGMNVASDGVVICRRCTGTRARRGRG